MFSKVRIKAERVVGEAVAQIVEESNIPLPGAIKVDRVVPTITGVTDHVFPGKVVKQGFVHKQIFFVDSTGVVRHIAVDVPFMVAVDIPATVPGNIVENFLQDIFVDFTLVNGVLMEKVVAHVLIKVTVLEQIDVFTGFKGVFTTGPAAGRTLFTFMGNDC